MGRILLGTSFRALLPLYLVSTAQASCIASGTEARINAALTSVGSVAVLCHGAVFTLQNPVTFTAANKKIYTEGSPVGATRATLRVTGAEQSTYTELWG